MSDPHALKDRDKTPRAQPLQPDKPGSGDQQQAQTSSGSADRQDSAAGAARQTASRQKSQSEDALDNVREGYD